jgi:hypothetical protein
VVCGFIHCRRRYRRAALDQRERARRSAAAGERGLVGLGLQQALDGWSLAAADALSSDGGVITGLAAGSDGHVQAFVATLPAGALAEFH